jgi:flagellar P-ring protein precursor FlgI
VSSLGDATTLEGGTLLLTPLQDRFGELYAFAQGPLSIGGFNVQVDDNKIVSNYTLVGRIPGGATVEREPKHLDVDPDAFTMTLFDPDYTTVQRIARSINQRFPDAATAIDDASLTLSVPHRLRSDNGRVEFLTAIEHLRVEPDTRAKVVINERTGTIVAGGRVSIAPIALAHGNITVEVKSYPVISQPAPFSEGETVETQDSYIHVTDEQARVVYFEERSTISDIASALNAIGAAPRDIIAIFQAIKQAGALRAELIIL